MSGPDAKSYDEIFYERLATGVRASASAVLAVVSSIVAPRSVLDVGCGAGAWLAEWKSIGVEDFLGIDGDYVKREVLEIPSNRFLARDLAAEVDLGRRYDLVQSLEVAEHLPADAADRFVESLVRHGDVILFSAAVPGQAGTHHINLQWPSYWVAKFKSHGYEVFDILRPRLWGDERIDYWYRQNVMLFATGAAADHLRGLGMTGMPVLDLAHPGLVGDLIGASEVSIVRRLVWSLVPATTRSGVRRMLRSRH